MKKILIFGNSGSGKSTLAKALCEAEGLPHLDLDTLAWLPTSPPVRMPRTESEKKMAAFINANASWVVEGCYADLLEMATHHATEIIYMDLSVADCIANAKSRPWEPHKYKSKNAQDANLTMLIDWISQYGKRGGPCSNPDIS